MKHILTFTLFLFIIGFSPEISSHLPDTCTIEIFSGGYMPTIEEMACSEID